MALDVGPIATEHQLPCRTLVARLVRTLHTTQTRHGACGGPLGPSCRVLPMGLSSVRMVNGQSWGDLRRRRPMFLSGPQPPAPPQGTAPFTTEEAQSQGPT